MHGTSLKQITKIAGGLSLSPRALGVDLDQLDKLATLAILYWDLNHFVVLKHIRSNRVESHDPVDGVTLRLSPVSWAVCRAVRSAAKQRTTSRILRSDRFEPFE